MATKKTTGTPAKSAIKTASKTASKPAVEPATKPAAKAATTTASTTASKTPAKKGTATAAATPKAAASEKQAPTHEEISHLAHQYWKERGHHHGSHEDDWTRAERELKARA